jgi:hypothetical protein
LRQAFCLRDTDHYSIYTALLGAFHRANIFHSDAILKWSESDPMFEFIPKSPSDFRFQNSHWIRSLRSPLDWIAPDITLCDSACDCTSFSDTTLVQHDDTICSTEKSLHWANKKTIREFVSPNEPEEERLSDYQECDQDICECCST